MLKNLFQRIGQRKPRPVGRSQRRNGGPATVKRLPEMLEKRFAMSVNTVLSVITDGADGAYTTVAVDSGTEVFAQHIGDSQQSLRIANNSSFRGSSKIGPDIDVDQALSFPYFNRDFDTLGIYEGSPFRGTGPLRPTSYPYYYGNQSTASMIFVLPSLNLDRDELVSGTLTVDAEGDGISVKQWTIQPFTPNSLPPNGTVQLTSGISIGASVRFLSTSAGLMAFEIAVNRSELGDFSPSDRVELTLNYDADVSVGTGDPDLTFPITAANLLPAANRSVQVQVFDPSSIGKLVPGSMRGTATVSMTGENEQLAFAVGRVPAYTKQDGSDVYRVYFSQRSSEESFEESLLRLTREIEISGDIHVNSNQFDTAFRNQTQRQVEGALLDTGTGILTVESDGFFGFEVDNFEASSYTATGSSAASSVTLFAGSEHRAGLEVVLPSRNSVIRVDSRVDIGAVDSEIVLAASRIEVNSAVRTNGKFLVPNGVDVSQDYLKGVVSEELFVDAPLVAAEADIFLADREDSSTPNRGLLAVGAGGAIADDDRFFDIGPFPADGNRWQGIVPSQRLFVQVENGDIRVDGVVAAVDQTYVMFSAPSDRFKAPFVFATGSYAYGSGQIQGSTLLVSLGNDVYGNQLSTSAFSMVDLNTDIDRLRVRAGTRRGDGSGVPFPYELRVNDVSGLIVDAVSASSREINISAGAGVAPGLAAGELVVNAAVRSGGNVMLSSGDAVLVNAPVETSFGQITIDAPDVALNAAVRVLDTIPDERRTDISIRATSIDTIDPDTGVLVRQALGLGDRIAAVNNVQLVSENGSIGGRGLVTADTLLATAAENVILHTDVNRAKVDIQTPTITSPGTTGIIALYEEDYFAVDARNAETVVLAAQGDDAFLVDPREPDAGRKLSSAVIGRLSDAQKIFATAPSGSIDITVAASTDVQLGNLDAADIATITQTNPLFQLDTMLAAGSVSVVGEDATSVQLFDSPNALSGAINARFATQLPITSKDRRDAAKDDDVRWTPGQPGFDRAELEFRLPVTDVMKLTGFVGATDPDPELTAGFLDNWNQNFRESDLILVKDGAVLEVPESPDLEGTPDRKVNGVYQVAERSYDQDESGITLMTVRLVRLQSRDQTSEVARTHYVKVAEFGPTAESALTGGNESVEGTKASEWVSWQGVSVVGPDSVSSPFYTNIAVREIDSRPGFTPVKAATTLPIAGSYQSRFESVDHGDDPPHYGRITSRVEQAIDNASELFGGVVLEKGDLVLVQFGTDQDQNPGALASARTNGIYRVVNVGRNQNSAGLNGDQWELERYRGVDENGDGAIDEVFTGIAVVNQGRLRTSLTGKMFEYSYDAINNGEIRYTPLTGRHFITDEEASDRTAYYETRIDSEIEGAAIDLTVSAASGGNNDGGTMGRMLNLLQQNQTDRPMLLTFDANLIRQDGGGTRAVVSLTEELPAITRAVSIDGRNVIVDGSGIVARSDGQELRVTAQGRYFGPVRPSEVAIARRTLPLTRAATVGGRAGANGLVFGENTDGSIVRNLSIGGFAEGAAVLVQGADNILLENAVVGGGAAEFTAIGKRLTNNFGVVVRSWGEKTGLGVTLRDVSINDATAVGVQLEDGTQGVRIIESTVGSEGYRNEVGVRVGEPVAADAATPAGEYLHHLIGVAGDPDATRLVDQTVTLSEAPQPTKSEEEAQPWLVPQQWLVKVDASLVTAGLRPGMAAYDPVSGRIWTVRSVAPAEAAATDVVVKLELRDGPFWADADNVASWSAAVEFGTLLKLEEGSDIVSIPYGGSDFRNIFLGQEVSVSDAAAFGTAPTVRLILPNSASLSVSLKDDGSGEVEEVRVVDGGSGYEPYETIDLIFEGTIDENGEHATGTATADKDGSITAVEISNSGKGYQDSPTVAAPVKKAPSTKLELSENATRSGWVFATFTVPDGRNDIAYNGTGIVLEGAATRIVSTDVRESLGVGILVNGVRVWDETEVAPAIAEQPVIEIGGQGVAAARTWSAPDERNVAVFANRGAGIVLEEKVFDDIGRAILDDFETSTGDLSREDRDMLRAKFSSYLLIAGNYLGRNINGDEELANGTGVARNIGVPSSISGKAAAFAEAIFNGSEGSDLREDHDGDANDDEQERPVQPEDYVSLERYRALFKPEDFAGQSDAFTFDAEIGELDPRILLDRTKIQELESISERDSLSNQHGMVPKYQAGDDNPDDPVGGGGSGNNSDDGSGGGNWWDFWPTLR